MEQSIKLLTGGASLSFTSESRYFDRRSAFRGSIECIRTAIETQFCHSVHDSGRYSNRFPRLIKRRFPSKCITSTDKRGYRQIRCRYIEVMSFDLSRLAVGLPPIGCLTGGPLCGNRNEIVGEKTSFPICI